MRRVLLFSVVVLSGCASIKESWKEDKEMRIYYKQVHAYHECVDAYKNEHAYEIMMCNKETREYESCESDHYDKYPMQLGKSCPQTGPGFLVDQLYYMFFAPDNECGYERDPVFRDGDPLVEDSCGGGPPYSCREWACEYPDNPRHDYGPPQEDDGA